jgi:hypothetical protein
VDRLRALTPEPGVAVQDGARLPSFNTRDASQGNATGPENQPRSVLSDGRPPGNYYYYVTAELSGECFGTGKKKKSGSEMRRNLPCRAAQPTASAHAKTGGEAAGVAHEATGGTYREAAAASRAGRGGGHARGGRSHCRIMRTNSTARGVTPCSGARSFELHARLCGNHQPLTHRPRTMGDDADVHRTERIDRSTAGQRSSNSKPGAALPIGALLTRMTD